MDLVPMTSELPDLTSLRWGSRCRTRKEKPTDPVSITHATRHHKSYVRFYIYLREQWMARTLSIN